MAQRFDRTVIELVETAARAYKTAPLILGGTGGEGGGVGIPPGGVVGQLAQYRVAYDTTEAATLATLPSGVAGISGWSLVDNLNHIRYRLNTLESGGAGTFTLVDDNTSTTYSDVSTLHVSGGVLVTDLGGGSISLEVTASGVGGGGQPVASYYQAGSHDSITDGTDGNQLSIDTEYIDQASIASVSSNNVIISSDGWYSVRAIIGIHGTSAFNGKTTAYVNDAYTTKTYETAENITNDIFEVGPFILQVSGGPYTISVYLDDHLGENITAWVYELSIEPNSASGGGGGSLDGTYLRLDTTNNPLTDSLEIINDNNGNAGIYVQTTGDAFTADFEQYTVNNNVSSPALFLYQETSGSGTVYGEAIEAWRSDTGAGAIVANWLTFHNADTSNDDFIVDKDGHAYDNGQRLITDAPSDGNSYARKNAAWVTVSGGSGSLGANQFYIDQSGGTSDTYGALSGVVNSSNTLYGVSQSGYISGSLLVYLNGQLQTQGTSEDWIETSPSTGTFTFITAPTTGDLITASYYKSITASGNADTLDGYHASSFLTSTLVTTTTDRTILSSDQVILCNNTSAITLALPTATGTGKVYNIKSINIGTVTISGYSTQTIDGYNTKIINTIYDNLTIIDGGAGAWYIL